MEDEILTYQLINFIISEVADRVIYCLDNIGQVVGQKHLLIMGIKRKAQCYVADIHQSSLCPWLLPL